MVAKSIIIYKWKDKDILPKVMAFINCPHLMSFSSMWYTSLRIFLNKLIQSVNWGDFFLFLVFQDPLSLTLSTFPCEFFRIVSYSRCLLLACWGKEDLNSAEPEASAQLWGQKWFHFPSKKLSFAKATDEIPHLFCISVVRIWKELGTTTLNPIIGISPFEGK